MHDRVSQTCGYTPAAHIRWLFMIIWLWCSGAAAQPPVLYDTEVVVFRALSARTDGEVFPLNPAETPVGFTAAPIQAGTEELASSDHSLGNVADALQRSGAYDVLVHKRWRQPGNNRDDANPFQMHTTDRRYRLDGSVTFIRERFLHLSVDLSLTKIQDPAAAGPGEYPEARVYKLREARRVRSGELHYFDHPWFGVIARVTPHAAEEFPLVETAPASEAGPADPAPSSEQGGDALPGDDAGAASP